MLLDRCGSESWPGVIVSIVDGLDPCSFGGVTSTSMEVSDEVSFGWLVVCTHSSWNSIFGVV